MWKLWIVCICAASTLAAPGCGGPQVETPITHSDSVNTVIPANSNYDVIHFFHGRTDGGNPDSGVTLSNGYLFGTTVKGGGAPQKNCGAHGCGTAYELQPQGKDFLLSTLYRFQGPDGAYPSGNLTAQGTTLYGVTGAGGTHEQGTFFTLQGAAYKFSSRYSFSGSPNDGSDPTGLTAFRGSLFGMSISSDCSCIILFKLHKSNGNYTESPVALLPESYGAEPSGNLIINNAGTIYGESVHGGPLRKTRCPLGCGVIFSVRPHGPSISAIHEFTGRNDGAFPHGGLFRDASGNLFGTSTSGGGTGCQRGGCGTVFEISPSRSGYSFHTIYAFKGAADGQAPASGIVEDANGNIFGTTTLGYQSIFQLAPAKKGYTKTTLHLFGEKGDGVNPAGPLLLSNGYLYGTFSSGGFSRCDSGCGGIYRLRLSSSNTL